MKKFIVKHEYVPYTGNLDRESKLLGERILCKVCKNTLQRLTAGTVLDMIDTVWARPVNMLMGRFRTVTGDLVCITYAELDELLQEV